MAVEGKELIYNLLAAEDLSAMQYKAVALDDGKVANNGLEVFGILKNKPQSGEQASVCIFGITKGYAGGAITKAKTVTVATSGWLAAADSGDGVIGRAMETAASGDIIPIFLHQPFYAPHSLSKL